MKEIQLPRGYMVATHRYLSYAEACAHAANLSDYDVRPITVTRDPLVKGGEEIHGEATVACFQGGRMLFPNPTPICHCESQPRVCPC